jgi:integrase
MKKKQQWPRVYSRSHRSGNVGYIVDLGLIDGKRERHSFKTKAEAETFADLKRTEKVNEGTAGLSLSQSTRVEAVKAEKLLKPHGATLLEATNYYLKHVIAFRNSPSISEVVQQLLQDAETNQRRDRTIGELKYRLTAFAEDYPDLRLSDITADDIREWIDEEEWCARTRINYLTKISQLFNYALKKGWVDSNVVERIDRPSAEDKEPGIFTVNQAKALLENAKDSQLLPYISIGLFAGLRSAEMMRLDVSAINLQEKSIVVGAQIAKKRSRRVVEMTDALVAWLKLCLPLNGPIVDACKFRDNLEILKHAAKIEHWPHNGLRHSFGSYHLSFFGDQMKTAALMGHRDPSVVHNHYTALVVKSEAEKFWKLSPEPPDSVKSKEKRVAKEPTPTAIAPIPLTNADPG